MLKNKCRHFLHRHRIGMRGLLHPLVNDTVNGRRCVHIRKQQRVDSRWANRVQQTQNDNRFRW